MSDETLKTGKRAYRKRLRAEHEEETRRRITEAAVDLHGSVGPARTTISAIADRAGVQRATVYRHFPDEPSLFAACSAHWAAANPPPDPTAWAKVADPDARLHAALDALYRWYESSECMLENVSRDAPVVPAMARPVAARKAMLDYMTSVLMARRRARGARRRRVEAAIGHALEFSTWQSLVRHQGLTRPDAVALAAAMVTGA